VGSQQTVQLTKDHYNVSDPQWSPDGRWIAFVKRPTPKADDAQFSDIMILSAEGGTPRKLVENEGPDTSPRWSPDGQWIAYVSSPRPFYGNQNDVYVVPASGGTPRSLTAALDRNETNPIWSPDGKTIYFEATTGVNHYFFSVPVSQGAIKPLINGNRVCSAVQLAKDGSFFALTLSDPMHPADLWVCRADGSGLRQLTRANPQLDDLKLGATETVRWKSPAGGWEIEGLLVKPADYQPGKKYPLIVEPHGGPAGVVTNSFRSMWQVLAGRGYAVLAPNFRGSDGYGKKFIEANVGDWGGGDYQDVMSGVDALIAKGNADPARLGVEGWSYGGFMTSWIVTHTNRFKAAVDGAGVTDLLSMYGTTDIQRFNEYYMLGRPWEKFEVYRKNSPMTYIAQAKTPTLILHGIEDRRVPISQGEEFYIGLKKVSVETEFVRYPREPHGFTEPNHQIDRIQRTVAWFDKYLKPNGE
jgi:dipeptidyl aminopeptidase/acylaminoacyl peptidase